MTFYSQCGEDKHVYEKYFKNKRNGVFLELGALDGITYSNTKFFEESLGWTGVLIEPIPDYCSKIATHRTKSKIYNNIVSTSPEPMEIYVNGAVSSVKEYTTQQYYDGWHKGKDIQIIQVPSRRLDDILDDAGMKLNVKGLPRFREYIEQVRDVLVFSTNDSYVPQRFVKQDAIMNYFPEFNDTSRFKRYYYAGVMLFRKTSKTMALVRDYLSLCETEWLLDNSETGRYPRSALFQGQDTDNGVFNLCLAKHNICTDIYPDETNLYDSSGTQTYDATDWSSLDAYPLQCRRLRPGNKQYNHVQISNLYT